MNILATPPHPLDKRRSVPRPVAFWLAGAAIATVTAASNPTLRWLPSQNGLFADAPHRHSATRVSSLTGVWS
jgi:hypothetical protein